jgi:hypothetical protein
MRSALYFVAEVLFSRPDSSPWLWIAMMLLFNKLVYVSIAVATFTDRQPQDFYSSNTCE